MFDKRDSLKMTVCGCIRFGAFSKMAARLMLLGLLAACGGHPVSEGTDTTVATSTDTTPLVPPTPEIEGHSMDDILPGTKAPPSIVVFNDVPQHTETELGTSVLLACRTANPVAECQWSWQPLPPIHLPLPDISETSLLTTPDPLNTTSTLPKTQALPVRLFPAFGNNSNDCSVRFSSTKHEQAGYWTCAARISTADPFFSTKPAKLSIVNTKEETPITFVVQEETVEAASGSSSQIMCRTRTPVGECQWLWRQLNQSNSHWNQEVKKFPAFGNDSTDCSIKFKNVLPEQEGFWTCGARISPNSTFTHSSSTRFLISEVEFVQLSRGIQIAAGETVFLRCLVNKPVVQCEWSWKPTNSSKDSTVVKKFVPNKDADRDCSVRFKNILHEEEGLWTCGVRLTPEGQLHDAPPATVSLLPPAKVNFVESPEDTAVPIGTEATLKCVTNTRVEKCMWTWKPLTGNDVEVVVKEFPSNGDLGKDCSLTFQHVFAEQQGYWGCQVLMSPLNNVHTASSVKLTMFERDDVKFSELSQDIQISSGGSVLLRCVTSSAVEHCRWSLTPANSNTTVVVKQFPAAGAEGRDCSVRLSHALAEQEGLWTCGARVHGQESYTDAPPAKLSLLQPDPVIVAMWASTHQSITLTCKVGPVPTGAICHWLHAPDIQIHQNNSSGKSRYKLLMNNSTGLCTLQFKADHPDLGQWTCRFTLNQENGDLELGTGSLIVLNKLEDNKLGWIVGALTTMVLVLMIVVVVLVICKAGFFSPRMPQVLETISSAEKKRRRRQSADRYTEGPAKIDFRFNEQNPGLNLQNISDSTLNRAPHLYEEVQQSNISTPKTLYANVNCS